MNPIYVPTGKAKEYGDYALNIYTGCPHRCFYCFAPSVLRKEREAFHNNVRPRENIVEATRQQLRRENITGKLIHLCFTCDPYPYGCDSSVTREIISLLKEYGNHVQILTKNGLDAMHDFDLLDENDWFGITYAGYDFDIFMKPGASKFEPGAGLVEHRLSALYEAKKRGIKTWVSVEPVLNAPDALNFMEFADYVDLWKVGKMNYHPSTIDWATFGKAAEATLIDKKKRLGIQYYIKEGLRAEMEKE